MEVELVVMSVGTASLETRTSSSSLSVAKLSMVSEILPQEIAVVIPMHRNSLPPPSCYRLRARPGHTSTRVIPATQVPGPFRVPSRPSSNRWLAVVCMAWIPRCPCAMNHRGNP